MKIKSLDQIARDVELVTSEVQAQLNLKANIDAMSGAVFIGSGTTAQRPTLPLEARAIWYNTELLKFEGWNGTQWLGIGGGATGGGPDTVFIENEYTITTNYTIPAGKSAVSVGDSSGNIYFNSGVQVDFSAGSRWVIL